MKRRLNLFILFFLVVLCVFNVSAEDNKVRVEAEDFVPEVSNPAVADDENMSGGKFIGIDSTSGHVIIYDKIPASKAFLVNYRAIHTDTVLHVFIEKEGEFESLMDIEIEPTGEDWGAPFLNTSEIEVDIPQDAKLKFTATGSISIDYFEFTLAEEEDTNPPTGDMVFIPYACVSILILLKKISFAN